MSSATKKGYIQEEEDIGLRRGPWTVEEDNLLIHYITCHGEGRWNLAARSSGLKRTGKSCRLRWLNYLKPDVKRGNLTPEEQLVILELHSKWGNRWSKIAEQLPGRTDNEIKNYWRTRVQKQARQLKIDANSARFRDVIRLFWMPRLLQKIASSPYGQSLNPTSSNLLNLVPQPSPSSDPESLSTSEQNSTITSSYGSYISYSGEGSPSICSNSMNITQLPQISPSPQVFGDIDNTPLLKDCYDSNSYDLEALHLGSTSTPSFNYPVSEFSVTENFNADEMVDCLWNMDELWQFRKPQGRSI